jgi:hypothetical protein
MIQVAVPEFDPFVDAPIVYPILSTLKPLILPQVGFSMPHESSVATTPIKTKIDSTSITELQITTQHQSKTNTIIFHSMMYFINWFQ